LAPEKNLSAASFWVKEERAQTIYRFGLPCTMFGFCDESPEANPHNPIFCGVCSPDPCCEPCGGGMGQNKNQIQSPVELALRGYSAEYPEQTTTSLQ
jgi:hypothetical protein